VFFSKLSLWFYSIFLKDLLHPISENHLLSHRCFETLILLISRLLFTSCAASTINKNWFCFVVLFESEQNCHKTNLHSCIFSNDCRWIPQVYVHLRFVDFGCIYFSAKPVASIILCFWVCPLQDKMTDNTSKKI
jgi:hypothetical protein